MDLTSLSKAISDIEKKDDKPIETVGTDRLSCPACGGKIKEECRSKDKTSTVAMV